MRLPLSGGGLSPLAWAAYRDLPEVVDLLLQRFPAEAPLSAERALFQACHLKRTDVWRLLAGAFPEAARRGAGVHLVEASRAGNLEVALLLARRFPEEAGASAARALAEACWSGHAQLALSLLDDFPAEARAALGGAAPAGRSPLHGACRQGLSRVARALLERFPEEAVAALSREDDGGRTPVSWALGSGNDDLVSLLLQKFPSGHVRTAAKEEDEEEAVDERPEMMQAAGLAGLERSGYRTVGSHSAVKQCRWTKNALRGQGQCYKHTFYGINSHQCMEATPSLACANKCVFCWRNHKNPVATSWKFKEDDPEWIVQESVERHCELVAEAAASPHALPERVLEARTVRHTALSLVGEPVLYPQIEEYLAALHRRRISTFLVTNGQFPEQLRGLPQVTQLYVSVDAPDPEELKAVGRPLFRDYWERLRESLRILAEKGSRQRTVCRLTCLKGRNMEEDAYDGYAELIAASDCDFVEIKGATFAPVFEQDKSGLSRDSTPSHADVRSFARGLASRLPGYGLACEHEHSCAVLLAHRARFCGPGGRWRTWIDFDRFADASAEGRQLDVEEFALETPDWALARDSFVPGNFEQPGAFGHKMMGDVAVLSPGGGPAEEAAAAAELLRRPSVRSVAALVPADGHRGARARHVAGDPNLEILYQEFGLRFRLDLSRQLSRLSRSQGGVDERQRLRSLVQPGERILVLCSRFGVTSCLLGRREPLASGTGRGTI
ncbi:unnamed protein product [Prorocentrum cordatum]|uniref:Radical SAM core domain-containing protein n=1 Tax=Prorocentrum cordatum TaxID=2364126 RepID=A0ABN9RNX1_9DINO|nr:unnamed protein product [Polarella glacialis]